MEKIKYWFGVWKSTAKLFFKHPIFTTRQFLKDFMEADIKGKLKKIVLAILFFYISYEAFIAVCALIILAFVFLVALPNNAEEDDEWERQMAEEDYWFNHRNRL